MLNFEAFTGRDLQNAIALLTICEREGIDTISVLKKEIEDHLQLRIVVGKKHQKEVITKVHKERQGYKCPMCDEGILLPIINAEKLLILGCKKCRYSEIMK